MAGTVTVERIVRFLSVFTMLMTLPQVWKIWIDREAQGVSLLSWSAYFLTSCVWFVYGLQKHDPTIYIACIGWILLNGAVVTGVVLFG